MTTKAPALITLACVRPDCTNTVQALPGSTAVCGKHPRPAAMQPTNPLPLGDTQ